MNYLSGYLEGIKKMINDDKCCVMLLNRMRPVVAAIKQVNRMILRNHLDTCVAEAIKGKSEKGRKKKIKELLEIFKNSDKYFWYKWT